MALLLVYKYFLYFIIKVEWRHQSVGALGVYGSHGIEPTRDCTNFLKIGFVVPRGGFNSYFNLQSIKSEKERKNVRKKYAYKKN